MEDTQHRPSRDEALDRAAAIYADAATALDDQPIREAAAAAHVPGGPSLDELTAQLEERRRG